VSLYFIRLPSLKFLGLNSRFEDMTDFSVTHGVNRPGELDFWTFEFDLY